MKCMLAVGAACGLLVAGISLAAAATPVPVQAGTATLTPENTKIEFVGTHMPPKQPDPRTGGFEKFTGKLQVDAAAKALRSVSIEIDTTTLWTEVGGRLTDHLKSPDFLEVRQYPTIKFESTKIEPAGGEGKARITGKLTLHGVTKEISFPATVQVGEGGLVLNSEFSFDRLEYGINYSPEQVAKKVAISVVVGEKTQPRQGGGFGKGGGKNKKVK